MPLFCEGKPGDLYNFEANGVNYDEDQLLSPVRLQHSVRVDKMRTTLECRGNVAGMFRDWLGKENNTVKLEDNGLSMEVSYTGVGAFVPSYGYDTHYLTATFPAGLPSGDYVFLVEREAVMLFNWAGKFAGDVVESGGQIIPVQVVTWRGVETALILSQLTTGFYVHTDWSVYSYPVEFRWRIRLAYANNHNAVVAVAHVKSEMQNLYDLS
jgi:hypothetical protein